MVWTPPMTAVANTVFTAAQFNTHVRDNLNETAPAKATTASRLIVTTGLNSVMERELEEDTVATSQTTTSTAFTDLATVGPSITVNTGARAFITLSARLSNNTVNEASSISFEVSGATSSAANDARAFEMTSSTANAFIRGSTAGLFSGLNPGMNTFTMKYRVTGGTGTFLRRNISVLAL